MVESCKCKPTLHQAHGCANHYTRSLHCYLVWIAAVWIQLTYSKHIQSMVGNHGQTNLLLCNSLGIKLIERLHYLSVYLEAMHDGQTITKHLCRFLTHGVSSTTTAVSNTRNSPLVNSGKLSCKQHFNRAHIKS